MRMNTQKLLAGLVMLSVFASCSRPVAYFQPTAREHFATAPAKTEVAKSVDGSASATADVSVSTTDATPTSQAAQVDATMDQVNALVRSDNKLAADKTVQKRLNRVKALLAGASAKVTLTPTSTTAPKKMNLVERFMVKKINKKISKQLAPTHPEKAMANRGLLVGGIILLLVGLLLTLLASGTGATIGVILLLLGAISLVLGLLAS